MLVTRQYTDAEVADLLDELAMKLDQPTRNIACGTLAEAAKRLRSAMVSKTLAQHLEESVLARHVWPIKRAVGLRLQAVSHEHRHSYDILHDAACRGVDDGVREAGRNGSQE